MKNRFSRVFGLLVAIATVIAICLTLFTACNKAEPEDDGEIQRDLYLASIAFLPDSEEAVAYLTFTQNDDKIEGASVAWKSEDASSGVWYNTSNTYIIAPSARIFSAVQNFIPQEKLINDGVQYNRLKVIIRYDTIYKSIKSDGETSVANRVYSHFFTLDESSENQTFTLTLKTANSANWYGILIAFAIVVAAAACVAFLLAKGKLWQKKKTRE